MTNETQRRQDEYSKLVAQLESKHANCEATIDDILDLAALYVSAHREDDAISILRDLLKNAPHNNRALMLLCDTMLDNRRVDDFVTTIHDIATGLIEEKGELVAVGYTFLRTLKDIEVTTTGNKQEVLQLSLAAVKHAPAWPQLYCFLAWSYNDLRQYEEADNAIQCAIDCPTEVSDELSPWKQWFETMITGRASEISYFEAEYARMKKRR